MNLREFDLVRARLNPGDEPELFYIDQHVEKTLYYGVSLIRPSLGMVTLNSREAELFGNILETDIVRFESIVTKHKKASARDPSGHSRHPGTDFLVLAFGGVADRQNPAGWISRTTWSFFALFDAFRQGLADLGYIERKGASAVPSKPPGFSRVLVS
jgi:hypothetical protein